MTGTAAGVVVVPTLTPLNLYHVPDPADQGATRCGLPTHGWYWMTEQVARDLADWPCEVCAFAAIPSQRAG